MKRIIISFLILLVATSPHASMTQATYDQLTLNLLRLTVQYDVNILSGENIKINICNKIRVYNQLKLFSTESANLIGAKEMEKNLIQLIEAEKLKLNNVDCKTALFKGL